MTTALPIRVRPNSGESLVGYLMRAADANGLAGPHDILAELNGGSTRKPTRRLLLQLADFCRCTYREMEALFGFRISHSTGVPFWQLADECIAKDYFISSNTVALCPTCLAQNSYLRGKWELVFYLACADHRVDLLHSCPGCGKSITWRRQKVNQCSCGFDFRAARTPACKPLPWVVAQLVDRRVDDDTNQLEIPNGVDVSAVERMACLSLDSLFRIFWLFGRYLAVCPVESGHARRKPSPMEATGMIEATFDQFSAWPHALRRRICELAMPTPSPRARDLALAALVRYIRSDLTADDCAYVRASCEYLLRVAWRLSSNSIIKSSPQLELSLEQA